MKTRTVLAVVCGSLVATWTGTAQADPNNGGGPFGGQLHAHFFACSGRAGTPASFDAVRQMIGAPWLLTGSTAAFDVQSAFDETTDSLIFATPGFDKNGVPAVTCLFVAPLSGDTVHVSGILTPVGT
jgi:hypothetical protein